MNVHAVAVSNLNEHDTTQACRPRAKPIKTYHATTVYERPVGEFHRRLLGRRSFQQLQPLQLCGFPPYLAPERHPGQSPGISRTLGAWVDEAWAFRKQAGMPAARGIPAARQ